MTDTRHAARLLAALLLLCAAAWGAAQAAPPLGPLSQDGAVMEPVPGGQGDEEAAEDPGDIADAAVTEWLARAPLSIPQLTTLSPAELCQELPNLLIAPPPPQGTHVNLHDRTRQVSADGNTVTFSYSSRHGTGATEQLQVVQVVLQRTEAGGEWQVVSTGFRVPPPTGLRQWVQTPAASWLFSAFSLLVLFALLRPGPLRTWLARGRDVIRRHRGTYLFTMILLFGFFALGMFTGSQLPAECTDSIIETVATAITAVGATEAYGSGNIARAAAVTFYQNFIVVTMSVTFSLALLFGIPAYLFAIISFYAQAIPFGLPGVFSGADIPFVLLLLLLELTAYFTVVAGGGFFLVTLIRKGFAALPEAFTNLALMIPIAFVLLMIGAWYEAVILLL
jgi:hypothetical protein